MSVRVREGDGRLRVLYITSVCDPDHTISASAFTWASALAERCETVDVVALDVGGNPAANLRLHSLHRRERPRRVSLLPDLTSLLWRLTPACDVIFCQYSTKFVFVSAPFAKLFGKPIVLWWSHAHVDRRLELATRLATAIVTASSSSFLIPTAKKNVIGHGVDVRRFRPAEPLDRGLEQPFRILTVGRVTPVKEVETIVRAAGILRQRLGPEFQLDILGDTHSAVDQDYKERLRALAQDLDVAAQVRFPEPVPHSRVVPVLQQADAFVNAQAQGGAGRAWLEAMAIGLPTVLCTDALDEVIGDGDRRLLSFTPRDPADLADRLLTLATMDRVARLDFGARLRQIVIDHHSLDHLMDGLMAVLQQSTAPTRAAS